MLRKYAPSIAWFVALAMLGAGSHAQARTRIIAVANDLDAAAAGFAHLALNNAFLASAMRADSAWAELRAVPRRAD
jgi:hypothetical protein